MLEVGAEVLKYFCCSEGGGELLDGGEPVCDSFEVGGFFYWCFLFMVAFDRWWLVGSAVIPLLLVLEVVLIEWVLGVVTSTNSARCARVEVTLGVRSVDCG